MAGNTLKNLAPPTSDAPLVQRDLRHTRRAGSGFTIFVFGGVPIAFAQQVAHQSPRLVNNPSFIQPMDEPYPLEILVPIAAGPGTIILNLFDLWAKGDSIVSKVWDRLGNVNASNTETGTNIPGAIDTGPTQGYSAISGGGIFGNASDIVDIALIQAQVDPGKMQIVQYVRQIPDMDGQSTARNGDSGPTTANSHGGWIQYHGCTITDVRDDETIVVGTLEVIKQITVNYTYTTRQTGGNTNLAIMLRHGA